MAKGEKGGEQIDVAELKDAMERLTVVLDAAVAAITAAADSLHGIAGTLAKLEKGYSDHRRGVPAT